MTKRQKAKPAAKKAGATETPKQEAVHPKGKRELHRALRRLEKLRVSAVEIQVKANLRRMKESTETFSLLAQYCPEMRPLLWEMLPSWESTLESSLRASKAMETREQRRWQKWKKEPPQKRLKELSNMILENTLEAQGVSEMDLRPWAKAAKTLPPLEDMKAFLDRGKDFKKMQARADLQNAYFKARKLFEEVKNPLKKFASAWIDWEKKFKEAKEVGAVRVLENPSKKELEAYADKALGKAAKQLEAKAKQKPPKEGQNKSKKAKSPPIESKSPSLPLDGNAPKEGGKDL